MTMINFLDIPGELMRTINVSRSRSQPKPPFGVLGSEPGMCTAWGLEVAGKGLFSWDWLASQFRSLFL